MEIWGRIKALCLRQFYDWCGDLLRQVAAAAVVYSAAAAMHVLHPPQCGGRSAADASELHWKHGAMQVAR